MSLFFSLVTFWTFYYYKGLAFRLIRDFFCCLIPSITNSGQLYVTYANLIEIFPHYLFLFDLFILLISIRFLFKIKYRSIFHLVTTFGDHRPWLSFDFEVIPNISFSEFWTAFKRFGEVTFWPQIGLIRIIHQLINIKLWYFKPMVFDKQPIKTCKQN